MCLNSSASSANLEVGGEAEEGSGGNDGKVGSEGVLVFEGDIQGTGYRAPDDKKEQ